MRRDPNWLPASVLLLLAARRAAEQWRNTFERGNVSSVHNGLPNGFDASEPCILPR